MDPFSYLSVLLSIILGLGITQVLTSLGRLIRARSVVRSYWPPIVWALLLLVMYVQVWWAMFGLRVRTQWSFLSFFIVLLQTICLYMMAALLLPETTPEPTEVPRDVEGAAGVADLRAHYERQAPWFFGFLAATVLVSALKEVVLEGRLPLGANLAFHIFILVTSVVAIMSRSRRYHEVLSVVAAGAVVVYIGELFSRLG